MTCAAQLAVAAADGVMLGATAGADDAAGVAGAAEALAARVAAGVPDAAAGARELLQDVSAIARTAPDAQQVSLVLFTSFSFSLADCSAFRVDTP